MGITSFRSKENFCYFKCDYLWSVYRIACLSNMSSISDINQKRPHVVLAINSENLVGKFINITVNTWLCSKVVRIYKIRLDVD